MVEEKDIIKDEELFWQTNQQTCYVRKRIIEDRTLEFIQTEMQRKTE